MKENNDYIYLTILLVFVVLTVGTFIHDPLLHSFVATVNGWEIDNYQAGLMIGQTSVITTVAQANDVSTPSFWLFYMFPPLFIFIAIIVATFIKPDRLILVAGIILMALNLPSLNPEIKGSDSYNAIQFLITRGWAESSAYILHYILFFVVLVVWGLYLYVATENSQKDAKRRFANIIR